jgi:hypothetical protein
LRLEDLKAAAAKRPREEDEITTSSYMPSFRDPDQKSPMISYRHQSPKDFRKMLMLPSKIGLLGDNEQMSPIIERTNEKFSESLNPHLRDQSEFERSRNIDDLLSLKQSNGTKRSQQSQTTVKRIGLVGVNTNSLASIERDPHVELSNFYRSASRQSQQTESVGPTNTEPYHSLLQRNVKSTQSLLDDPQQMTDLKLFISTSKEQQESNLRKINKRLVELDCNILSMQNKMNGGSVNSSVISVSNDTKHYMMNLQSLLNHLTEQ